MCAPACKSEVLECLVRVHNLPHHRLVIPYFFGSFLVHGPCTVVNRVCHTFLTPCFIRRRLIFIETLQQGVTSVSLVTLPEFAEVEKLTKCEKQTTSNGLFSLKG